ncbi:uncharacterized protein LOC127846468 isoform X4 [Dreissena polymorpha]|uniref:uncharacterized protein LOC127846468 isoform X4 n=1 Tax=Dreissena polymorpha TaxID=45954 RepID=UPI002263D560|nr:uncharacterized protein LOC127846468 isoform X4 [Dreissena polymorpha]
MIASIILALAVTFGAARAQTGCDTKADITFLIDSSDNVGQQNFIKQLAFVRDVSNNMQLGPNKVQVSAVTFGTGAKNQFDLNQYSDKAALEAAIMSIQYNGGQPALANAIRYVTGSSFSPLHGGRADAPHVAVVLTNQPSGTIDTIKLQSQTAKDNGVIIYAVGIGNGVNMNELQTLASDPDSRHLYTANNFDALSSLKDILATKLCNELPPDPSKLPAPSSCLQKADVVFMVDSSTSVGQTNFAKLEHFLKDVMTKLNVGPNNVQVSVVKYGSYPSLEFSLTQHPSRPEALKAVEAMTYLGGGTNDADAFTFVGNQVMSQNHGARGDVPRIAVMITDGGSANSQAAIAAAQKLGQQNVGILAVGVGSQVNHAELNNIVDAPSSQNAFYVNAYDNLDSITNNLLTQMCKVTKMQPSISGATLPTDPCKDVESNCASYGADVCKTYQSWAQTHCAKFCGFCQPLYTAAPPKCVDTDPACQSYGRDICADRNSFFAQSCQLFCGYCGDSTSHVGYYGQCSYKGKTYATGEKWYDGCEYECICEDGASGRYKCNNRCPVYYNLPTDCTLVTQPGECCLQPVCNFNPQVTVQQSSGHGVSPAGIDVCVYKTKQYYQGQRWRDGCDYQCVCDDSKSGLYTCEELCPKYSSIPPYCHMETPAGECCAKPVCEFSSQTGSFQGTGTISGNGVGIQPTAHPPCVDVLSTCSSYGKSVCVDYRGWAAQNCRKYCDMCPDELAQPGPDDRCVYEGKLYQQGDTWNTSCDTTCTCENAIYGYYRCVNSCPSYNNLPQACSTVKKAGECCPIVECSTGTFYTSSITPSTIGNGGAITVLRPPSGMTQIRPTLPSGQTPPTGSGGTGFVPPSLNGCLYKGQLYVQNQAWEDGCDFACFCKDAATGLYSCKQKCPSYPNLAPSCHLEVDTNDECCMTPSCTPDPITHQIPVQIPVFLPATQNHVIVAPPTLMEVHSGQYTAYVTLYPPGFTPAPPTVQPGTNFGGGIGYCFYHGTQYTQGQTWEDGCEFNCICDNANTGHYTCTEKCVHYPPMPASCYMIKDPLNECCDIPKCNFGVNFVTHVGELRQTTVRPPGEYCVYGGAQYQQGQTWYDGCSYQCTCEDAVNNQYRCLTRCPEYPNVDETCTFLPDPKDPSCCVMPSCPSSTTPGTNPLIPTPAPTGTYIGTGMGTGYCEYKGVRYTQGQAWQDGCDFNCVCTDSESGLYRCTESCQRYNNLPQYCTLVTDFANPCCKKPRCNIPSGFSSTVFVPTGTTRPPTPPPPGQTVAPTNPPPLKYCVYKGVNYNQGETWEDGCQYKCRCDDSDKGLYTCNERCATYNNMPAMCKMVTDPEDSCCTVPSCIPPPGATPVPGQSTTPYQIPTAPPGEVTGSANVPTPRTGETPSPLTYCVYKGVQYSQGQRWDDGCQFTCECLDAGTGKYRCLEKCQKYVEVPANCRLARDPRNPCCQIPECNEPTPQPQFTPGPTPLPPTPPPNVCVYKGNYYTQGQQWYDGCDYACTCENSMTGVYTCNERCPHFGQLPAECTLVKSSSDPLCCQEPKCVFQNTKNQTTGFLTPPTAPPGVIDGGHATPTPLPTMAPSPGYSPTMGPSTTPAPQVCIYKGNMYQQGNTWRDGCEYNCECLDSMTGHYRCTEMCPKFDDLPAGCRLITDQYNPCCKKAYCPANLVPTPAPPGATPTPAPKATGCMYNGVLFKKGEQWNDGCDLQCVCEDEMTGVYRCRDRCNKYDVPEDCTLVTDPRDACCKVPYCETPTTPKPWNPGMIPTPAPGFTFAPNMIPTPAPGSTYAPGMFPTWVPGMVPTPAPGVTFAPNKIPTPYPGLTYAPGMFPTWVPGMAPTPAPGMTFAPNKMPTPGPDGLYPTWVPGMIPTPMPGQTFAPNMIPTPAPGSTYPPGMFPTWVPGMVPTPAPGVTYAPEKVPTPYPGGTYAPLKYPTYIPGMVPTPAPGMTYAPWQIPTPAPGQTFAPGLYPTYVPGMVPTPAPGMTYAPNMIPTPAPGSTYPPGQFPTWVPGMVPTPAPGMTFAPNKIPTPAPGLTYAPGKFPTWVPGMEPTPAPGFTYPSYLIPTPAPGQTFAPGYFPTPSPQPTPAPGQTFAPYVQGMVPTPRPGSTYAPYLIPTPAPGSTYAPGQFPTYLPGMVPTPAPGVTFAPWLIPGITPALGSTYAPFQYPTWVPGMVPTPAPGMTFAPNKIPSPGPDGRYPTWIPGMVPTPMPGSTFAPNMVPTPGVGSTYPPGQFPTWVPGMVPTPAPGVTYAPGKIPTPYPGGTYAPLQFPTWVPGMVPTPAPGVTYAPNMIPTPAPGFTFPPGQFPTYIAGMVPTPAPGVTYAPNMVPTPGPGRTFAPGMFPTWVPGMVPTPAPGVTFAPDKVPTPAYGSTYPPGQYPTWVPGMVPTPAPGQTFAPNMVPTPAPGFTYPPGQFPTWVPGMIPTPAPGVTFAPDKIPTPAPGSTYAPLQYPTWVPGMKPTPAPGFTYPSYLIPTPAPGQTFAPGYFPTPSPQPTPAPGQTYAPYVPGMVPTPQPGQTYAPNLVPTPAPGSTYAPGKFPTYLPGMVPTPSAHATFAPWLIPGITPAPGSTYAPFQYPTWVPGMVPTPGPPGMTFAPDKIPTPGPDGRYPTWIPGMVPTPMPGSTFAPNMVPTPGVGSTYPPGQFPTWVPGMVPTPAPGVTYAPGKIPTPYPGGTYAPLQFPTWVPGMIPTPAPGVTYAPNKIPTPYPGGTYAPGMYPTYVPGMVPTPQPGYTFAPNMIPTPGPGLTFPPGQYPTFVAGMIPTPQPGYTYAPDKVPTPGPGLTYAPGMYPTWVPGMVPTPAPGVTYAPNKIPTPYPGGTYAPGMYPTYVPGMVPTPQPGYTFAPNKIPTPGPGLTFPPGQYPTWVAGMVPTPAPGYTFAPDKIPTPGPGRTYAPGMYPTWVPGMVPTPSPGQTYAPNMIPTPGPGLTYAPGNYPAPTLNPYPVPTAIPGKFQGVAVGVNGSGCVHYGVVYNAGQTWKDGCKYDCECLDDHTGRYECKERCPLFLNLPTYCRLVIDPNDACCKIPVCVTPAPTPEPRTNPPTPAPTPGLPGQPTPSPQPTAQPTPQPTPQPKEGCVMNGQRYVAGQSWYMGCDQKCVCEDGMTGFYRCFDRCAKYASVPSGCQLVPDPKDPTCCQVPQCIPVPGPGQTVPTNGPFTVTGVPGVISGSGTPPTLIPGTGGYTNPPRNVCVYNGKMYTQGQKWQDGCQYDCVCVDSMTGKYECTERCPTFPLVPPQCRMERDPSDVCCFVPVCDYNQTSPSIPNLVSPSPGGPTQAPLPPSFCVYKGVAYQQGQIWDDGCDKKCRCDDADNNLYTCFDRCKSYNNLGSGCVMISDPSDSCCQIPQCTYVPTSGPALPGSTPPTVCPFPMPTAVPGVISGGPQPDPVTGVAPSNVGYCEYKGQQYRQGISWDDGCSYTCTCVDSNSGQYQCQEKCPRYVGIPSYCKMAQDPNNKCCSKPACNVCPNTPVPPTGPSPSATPAPKEVCVMNGQTYTQGQKWFIGCDKICVCDDGKTGVYTCNQRCPSYTQQAGCTMVPDQRDPQCCLAPKCPTDAGVFGTINGSGTPVQPGTNPPITGNNTPTPAPSVCVYKGKSYTQGQRWQDGCQYECVCVDSMTGQYSCTDRCPRFPDLPPSCHLVYDPVDPCCQKKECLTVTPTPFPGMLTPAPTPAPSSYFCVYQGIPYRQDQTFNKGCDQICKCEDAMTGKITCTDRCPTYPPLPANCTLTTDPNDQCCQIPVCTSPTGTVVGVPGTISGSNVPTNTYNPTGTRSGCVYNGQVFQQGQTWDDGCKYSCECLDSATGQYRCTEKCPRMPPMPSYCTLSRDPNNQCCQVPLCTPQTQTNPPPLGSTLTPTPAPPNVCVYKGSVYQQGQQWYDGCDYVCTCDDASKNFYNCRQRCAAYPSVPAGCTLVPNPADPTCCEIPNCPIVPQGPSPTPGIVTLAPQPPGVITGANPTPPPGSTLPPPYRSGCVYKGQLFFEGQTFDDGCDYECQCLSNMTGQYRCAEKCQKYSALPRQCVLVQDVNKPCCQVPYCDFTNPTPFPTGMPTPQPLIPTPRPGVVTVAPYIVPGISSSQPPSVNLSPTPFPPSPTPQPQGYCVYNGVYYTQGQTWNDGCAKTCRCEDVMRGYYTCFQRCPSYPPSSCPMKSDPNDQCCLMPDCNGPIPSAIPTPMPGQSTVNPTFTIKPVTGGSISGTNGGNPAIVPGIPGSGPSGSSPACVYKGMVYTQGQTWNDGCIYTCECVDSSRGQYICHDRCPKYPALPPTCSFVQSTTDSCCKQPVCNTYIQPTTPAPATTQPPVTIKPIDKCVYFDGRMFNQGDKWMDGCSVECECTYAAYNTFQCNDKCPMYSGLPSICVLITDPANSCCKKPQCTLTSGSTLTPLIGNATAPPNSLQILPVGTHNLTSGYGKPDNTVPGYRDKCAYKGVVYSQGQSWDDGCDFVCTCEDAQRGMYRCTSKCPQYPALPSYCKMVKIPGQCCPSMTCDIPGYGTYNPVPQLVPTPRPPGATSDPYLNSATNPPITGTGSNQCLYKGVLYNEGAIWDDGCDYRCECQDGRTGYYVCNPLCPVYNNLPSNQCYLVKANGQCCSTPMCYDPNTGKVVNPLTSQSVFPVVGTYQGGFTGFRPNTQTGGNFGNGVACVYKGKVYHKGDTWDDGCDFECTCIDETTGTYKCDAKCPTYTNIPPVCRFVDQPGNCCKRLTCTGPSVTGTIPPGTTILPPSTTPNKDPNCYDRINNCNAYGHVACQNYPDWARRNCEMYCSICTPMYTTAPTPCGDKLPDCKDFGSQACSGIYEPWARDNCAMFCGYCGSTPSGQVITSTTTPASSGCVDVLPTCNLLDKSYYCAGDYLSWAYTNCQKYCGLCNTIITTTPVSTTPAQSYPFEVLLKGVAGAPGPDLYQLWHSSQTLNTDKPLASHLTTEYNGHYKPGTSNNWNSKCFDQIRVSIYNGGVEKAYILFNATGSTKENWFTSDRIISSTWTDLKTTTKELMSLSGDANTGREFYISGHTSPGDSCDSFGWMMISTKATCFYEAGDAKPTFYYAPGTGLANWAMNNPLTGDLFVIQGRPTCNTGPSGQPTTTGTISTTAFCDYKNQHYTQGQMWTDGCSLNCTCVDAATGYYRCFDLCPKYAALPPGCTVEKKPGECCGQPTCSISNVITIKPIIIVGGTSFCVYKSQSYLQDQTWNDGCSQSCTCTDATRGLYSCRQVCLNWDSLPPICHMEDPPAGLCCQQPKCPNGAIIQIPQAYKDEYPGYSYV